MHSIKCWLRVGVDCCHYGSLTKNKQSVWIFTNSWVSFFLLLLNVYKIMLIDNIGGRKNYEVKALAFSCQDGDHLFVLVSSKDKGTWIIVMDWQQLIALQVIKVWVEFGDKDVVFATTLQPQRDQELTDNWICKFK